MREPLKTLWSWCGAAPRTALVSTESFGRRRLGWCFVLGAATLTTCAPVPPRRAVHVRLTDTLYAAQAPVPSGTADYPRGTINGDTRPVLNAAPPEGTPEFEHARVTLDIPEAAKLELAYGANLRGWMPLPPGGTVRFRVALLTDSGTATVLDDTRLPSESGLLPWKEVVVPLPRASAATLIFTSTTAGALAGRRFIPHFAAPVVTAPIRAPRPPNVILISLDTLRADHLGIYGYARATSPHIDRLFATTGVVVDRVVSQAANTPGGHIAMLKGMWPSTVFKTDTVLYSRAAVSIAEVLRSHGYRTAGFTEDALLKGSVGFNRGFDDGYYEELEVQRGIIGHIEGIFARGLAWLTRHRDEPVFLFLHTYQVHDPYEPPPAFAQRFPSPDDASAPERDRDRYDAEIAYTDEQVARLVQAIDALGLRDNTILIITSDHGEEFGEHGRRLHGSNLTNEILHVPLLIRAPGLLPAGVRRDGPMALMDLAPTLLDLLGFDAPESMQGRALTQHLRQGTPVESQPIFSEAQGARAETYGGIDRWYRPSFAVTHWPWRLVRIRTDGNKGMRYELYNLATDPGEKHNVYPQRAEEAETLRIAVDLYEPNARSVQLTLERRLSQVQAGALATAEPDPARDEKMRALGYNPEWGF